ncbi:MAG: protein kinase, partial [Chloroflexota bacterium]
ERIGSGGMAVVYRARHKQLQKDVALKMMHESIADDPDLLQRFLREAQIVSRLSHPNIVGLFDYDAENNQSFLVMQYINGRALKWHLRKRVLPLAEINTICTAIANALTYAHENDVLHRDVKPGNVIIAEDGTPFLTDFGLARVVSQGESSLSAGMIVGTPHYLSPEQASGEYEIGPAADIYALGVMLYEMVVGRVPFAAETPHAIVHDQIYTAPPRPTLVNPEIPADVEDVLMRVLEKDPSERYTTANDLMDAFNLAIQQSGLLELSEDRREIAAQSMAKLRKERVTPSRGTVEAEIDTGAVRDVLNDAGRLIASRFAPQVNNRVNQIRDAIRKVSDGEDRPYTPPTPDELEKQIQQRVERRVNARAGWRTHLVAFVVVNAAIFAVGAVGSSVGAAPIRLNIQQDLAAGDMAGAAAAEIGLVAAQQPWALVGLLLWLGGLMAHRLAVGALSSRVEDKRERMLMDALAKDYGPDWRSSITEGQYVRVEKGVDDYFCKVRVFQQHVIQFVFGSAAIVMLFGLLRPVLIEWSEYLALSPTTDGWAEVLGVIIQQPAFVPIILVWLVILSVHAFKTYTGKPINMEDELERERSLTYERHNTPHPAQQSDKRKNNLEDAPLPGVRLSADGELTNSTVDAWQNRK